MGTKDIVNSIINDFRFRKLKREVAGLKLNGFSSEITDTRKQVEAFNGRIKILNSIDTSEKIKNICSECQNQFFRNVKYEIALLNSYGYKKCTRSEKQLIRDIIKQNEEIIRQLNALIERELIIEKDSSDIESIDELIVSLQEMIQ